MPDVARAVASSLEGSTCPHLAVLLRTFDELYPVLASFYALGVERHGWLVHRAFPGQAQRDRELLTAAGLEVAALEADERLVVAELDFSGPPQDYGRPWEAPLEAALARGFTGLWYSRFAVGTEGAPEATIERLVAYERDWDRCFEDRPVITLCPFVVGTVDPAVVTDRLPGVAETHDAMIVPGEEGPPVETTRP